MVESSSQTTTTFDKLQSVIDLVNHYQTETSKTHLRELLNNEQRNEKLRASLHNDQENSDVILDLTHVKIDEAGL